MSVIVDAFLYMYTLAMVCELLVVFMRPKSISGSKIIGIRTYFLYSLLQQRDLSDGMVWVGLT